MDSFSVFASKKQAPRPPSPLSMAKYPPPPVYGHTATAVHKLSTPPAPCFGDGVPFRSERGRIPPNRSLGLIMWW